jgi:uncharacterized lipoprotein YajG
VSTAPGRLVGIVRPLITPFLELRKMTTTKSTLRVTLGMVLLAGSALLAGCSQPASTSTTEVSSAPPPVMSSSTTTQYRR